MIADDEIFKKLDELAKTTDPIIKIYQTELVAKEIGISISTLQRMLANYESQQKEEKLRSSRRGQIAYQVGYFLRKQNQNFSEMAFFKVLEYISKMSILLGIILFFWEIPSRHAAKVEAQRQTIYQSWQIVRSNQEKRSGSDLILALQDLNEAQQSLKGIDLSNAELSDYKKPLNLRNAWLVGAVFDNSKMHKANFEGAHISSGSFMHGSLTEVNFRKAYLSRTIFIDSLLSKSDFQKSRLNNANFQDAVLVDTQFQGAILTNVNFRNADIKGANFTGAIGLEVSQIQGAENWEKAIFSNDFLSEVER